MKWELFSEKKKKHKTIYNKNCYRKKEKKAIQRSATKGKIQLRTYWVTLQIGRPGFRCPQSDQEVRTSGPEDTKFEAQVTLTQIQLCYE